MQAKTLLEAVTFFADYDNCHDYMVQLRWPDGVRCPECGSKDVHYMPSVRRWKCKEKHPRPQFSLKSGTLFENSPIPLQKWLPAVWMVVNCKNGISSYELARALGVTQKTAWFMGHRIRMMLHTGSFDKLANEVEVDETFIGGKARNMHPDVKRRKIHGRGPGDKTIVLGMLERGGRVQAQVVRTRESGNLQRKVRKNVKKGTTVYTDELKSYNGLEESYAHKVINHAVRYVDGKIHTNGMENFWSLLKRALNGTYVSVEPFHLFRYLDEQAYRYNERQGSDLNRFTRALSRLVGRRVTWEQVTGQTRAPWVGRQRRGPKRRRPAA
jgi:transposase-like protein